MSKTLPIAGTETHCSCDTCKSMCERPCWPTPREALGLIKLGHQAKLMSDYWSGSINGTLNEGDDEYTYYDIRILCGANTGYAGGSAPSWPRGAPCVLQDKETKLCTVHNSGCKPTEGRLADCGDKTPDNLHQNVAALWENKQAQYLVDQWYDHHDDEDNSWADNIQLPEEAEITSEPVTNVAPPVSYEILTAYCGGDEVEVKRTDDTWSAGVILRREGPYWVVRVVKNADIPEDFRGHYGYKYVLDTDAPTYIRKG